MSSLLEVNASYSTAGNNKSLQKLKKAMKTKKEVCARSYVHYRSAAVMLILHVDLSYSA